MNSYICALLCATLFSGAYSEGLKVTATNINNSEVTTLTGPITYTVSDGDTVDFNCEVPKVEPDTPLPRYQTLYWLVCKRTGYYKLSSTRYCYETDPSPKNSNHMRLTYNKETGYPSRWLECIWRSRETGKTKQIKITVLIKDKE